MTNIRKPTGSPLPFTGGNPDTVSRSVGAGGVAPARAPAPTVPGTVSRAQGLGERGRADLSHPSKPLSLSPSPVGGRGEQLTYEEFYK